MEVKRVSIREAKKRIKNDPDDGNMQMLRFKDAKATFYSFTTEPEVVEF